MIATPGRFHLHAINDELYITSSTRFLLMCVRAMCKKKSQSLISSCISRRFTTSTYDLTCPGLPRRSIGHPRSRWDGRIYNFCWKIWRQYRGYHWFNIPSQYRLLNPEDEYVTRIADIPRASSISEKVMSLDEQLSAESAHELWKIYS